MADCPEEDHVHCDVCHHPIKFSEKIFATAEINGPIKIFCEEDAKKYAEAHDIMLEM